MWLRTTRHRFEGFERYCPEWLYGELCTETVAAQTRFDVRAPAIAWLFAREVLAETIFNHRGNRRTGTPRSLFGLMTDVTTWLNELERHPAMRGLAMLGQHAQWFPVWSQWEDDRQRIFSPYPNPGKFTILTPTWASYQQRQVTTWGLDGVLPPSGDRLASEDTHLSVVARQSITR